MKIYKSCYRSHWISPYNVLEYMFFWTKWSKCARTRDYISEEEYVYPPSWVEPVADFFTPVSRAIQWVLDIVHPRINIIKIDRYDTWSMDYTLSDIILPMLKQLKATKHGSPDVEDEDVPEELRSTAAGPKDNEWDTDSNWHKRWDWVLDEMIWAFEQKVDDNAEDQFFDHSAYEKGTGKTNHDAWFADMNNGVSRVKYDQEGHKKWQARKANGLRLFGKYFEALWD